MGFKLLFFVFFLPLFLFGGVHEKNEKPVRKGSVQSPAPFSAKDEIGHLKLVQQLIQTRMDYVMVKEMGGLSGAKESLKRTEEETDVDIQKVEKTLNENQAPEIKSIAEQYAKAFSPDSYEAKVIAAAPESEKPRLKMQMHQKKLTTLIALYSQKLKSE